MVAFRQGMLGVAVVVVAIAGALLGSWAMSMDVEERTVTTYDALTDITPLFDSEMAPAYTDYNPATNYTGYYTESSTIGDNRYFGGVDYQTADRPNNYKLNLPPIEAHSGTATLSNDSTAYNRQVWLDWWSPEIDGYRGWHGTYSWSDSIKSHHLTDVIAGITSQTTGKITLKSGEGPDLTDRSSTTLDMDWVIFGNINVYRGDHNYRFLTQEMKDNWTGVLRDDMQLISLSCVADMDRNIATLYYDNECTIRVCDLTLDQVIVFCRGGNHPVPGAGHHLMLSSTCEYDFAAFPESTYMNPSRGVEIES